MSRAYFDEVKKSGMYKPIIIIKIYGVKDSYIKYLSQYQEHLSLHEGVNTSVYFITKSKRN